MMKLVPIIAQLILLACLFLVTSGDNAALSDEKIYPEFQLTDIELAEDCENVANGKLIAYTAGFFNEKVS